MCIDTHCAIEKRGIFFSDFSELGVIVKVKSDQAGITAPIGWVNSDGITLWMELFTSSPTLRAPIHVLALQQSIHNGLDLRVLSLDGLEYVLLKYS